MIYLDYNATTPIDPRVAEAMLPYIHSYFGNPSSSHSFGAAPKQAVASAREHVAAMIGASFPEEIVFTSGGSESNNLAIQGAAFALRNMGNHIVTSSTEHPAVLATCEYLSREHGFHITYVPVDRVGAVDPAAVEKAITPRTILITIMHSNNETGAMQPIQAIGVIARKHDVLFHTDAAQSIGKVGIDVAQLNVDMLTVAGHKCYAPKGIGALYVRRGIELQPQILGASQEYGVRSGTENVPYIVALGEACRLAKLELAERQSHLSDMRDHLHRHITDRLDGVYLNGSEEDRLPNTLNISIQGAVGVELLERLPKLAASTGSACHSGNVEPSQVLLQMGVSESLAKAAVRLSVGMNTTLEEIEEAAALLVQAAQHIRARKPMREYKA
jgi:cysteine desulfurase